MIRSKLFKIMPSAMAAEVLTVLLLGLAAPASAGGIAGVIRDAGTSLPLSGIDLDLFDSTWTAVPGANATSAADGSYLFSPIAAGQYYLRADPNVDQGYADSYHPGVFLKSEALMLTVSTYGTTIVDFDLTPGVIISGTITNSGGSPLNLIDLDVYAWDHSYISSINAKTDIDGAYVLGCFPPGSFYVKADPAPADFVVDVYYDGKSDLNLADAVIVASIDVEGIDFALPVGGNITGTLRSQNTALPLPGIDIDLFDSAGNFVSSEGASSDSLGFYELGSLPPGLYYVQADADVSQSYVDTWYGDVFDGALAVPVSVGAGAVTAGIDINLPLGGTISGTLYSETDSSPLSGIDIDIFDAATGLFLVSTNAASDLNGYFQVGALPDGQFLVQADAIPTQGFVDTYYGNVFNQNLATPVTVNTGADTPGIDIIMPRGGTISGTVSRASDGMSLSGVHLSIFDGLTDNILVGAGGNTDANGAFIVGAVPAGNYLLRCNGVASLDLAFEFYPGVTFKSQADSIIVTVDADVPGHGFALDAGGWITGNVFGATNGSPLQGIDIDLYGVSGEFVGALDFESDPFGNYLLGPVPVETYVVKADPPFGSDYYFQYYDHTFFYSQAGQLPIVAGSTQSGIDFDLFLITEVDADVPPAPETGLGAAFPNPFNPQTTIPFRMSEAGRAELTVYDLGGRRVRQLASGYFEGGEHPIEWNGRDDRGNDLPSGIYFVEFRSRDLRQSQKLVLLR